MSDKKKICVIGGGHMGGAIIKTLHLSKNYSLSVFDKNISLKKHYQKMGIYFSDKFDNTLKDSDFVILAVRPQDVSVMAKELVLFLPKNVCLISVMAGICISDICDMFSISPKNVIRAMPNIGATVGKSVTVWTTKSKIFIDDITSIFSCLGTEIFTKDEKMINCATAVSGSGPAYFYSLCFSMIETAKEFGFNESDAEKMVIETCFGSLDLFSKKEKKISEMIKSIKSKGGTTEAGMAIFDSMGFSKIIQKAMQAAKNRAEEIENET